MHSLLVAIALSLGEPLAIEDLYRLESSKNPVPIGEGKFAFIRHWIDREKKIERNSLWFGDGTKNWPAESSEPDAREPIVSPDGKWILFLSTRERPKGWKQIPKTPLASDPAVDLWLIPTTGGPAIPLDGADKAYGRVFNDSFYGRVAFSPNGKQLVFIADDGVDVRTAQEKANDHRIVRQDQGEGYTGYGPAQIWVADLAEKAGEFAAAKIHRIASDDVWYGDPQWSPDGKTIVVHANKSDDRESARFSINKNFDLWSFDVKTGRATQLTKGPGPDVSPRFSPDGQSILFLNVPRKGPHRDIFNLGLVRLSAGGPQEQIIHDYHATPASHTHLPAPGFPLPQKCWLDKDQIQYNAELGTETKAAIVQLWNKKLVEMASQPTGAKGSFPGLPSSNALLKERQLGVQKVVSWKAPDGQTIEGVWTVPHESVAKAPYKTIVYPHGGPHSRTTTGFDFIVQAFAGQGYAVLQPNFRGSSGYGLKFLDADRYDLGGGDARDVLAGLDHLIAEGLVDKDRQFCFGTSYGGFMTTWLVGQTHRFRAACAVNAVTDLNMMWGLSDLQSWTQWEMGGLPWEVPERMRKMSPMTYVAKVKTPTLILHSRDDRRCPLPMGVAYHRALLSAGVKTEMVIYPNEGHGIRQPLHREDVIRRAVAWFQ